MSCNKILSKFLRIVFQGHRNKRITSNVRSLVTGSFSSTSIKDVKHDFGFWNIPDFHAKNIKVIADEALKEYAEDDSIEKFKYLDLYYQNKQFLEALAGFLSSEYQDDVKSSTLFVTYGATFGFNYLVNVFMQKGDTCIFEEVTFGFAMDYAKLHGMNIKTVPFDGDNISLTHLEETMKNNTKTTPCTKELPYNGMVYLLSVLHNPRGTSYSEACSKEVVNLARKYNYLVVTDDVYYSLQFKTEKANRLLYYDKIGRDESGKGNVVSNSTLSKTIFPSMRIGWIEGTEGMVQHLLDRPEINSGGGHNAFNQGIAAKILTNKNLKIYFKDLMGIYQQILHESCEYLKKNLPEQAKFRLPDGSAFVWVELPKDCNCEDIQNECWMRDAKISVGTNYGVDAEKYRNFFRIAVTNGKAEDREEGLRIICEAVKAVVTRK